MSRAIKLSQSNIEAAVEEDPKLAGVIAQLKQLDRDNNNELSLSEVAACVKDLAESEKQRKLLRNLVIAMTVLMLLFAAAIVGLTYAIVDLSKDTQVQGGVLQARDGDVNSYLSTGGVHGLHGDGATTLLMLTPANVSTMHSMMIPCTSCAASGSMDVYSVERVRLVSPGQLVAVYTGFGQPVIVADAQVPGLQVFANSTEADSYLEDASTENANGGSTRRRLFQTMEVVKGGVIINSASFSAPGRTKPQPAGKLLALANRSKPIVASKTVSGKKLLQVTPSCPYLKPYCYGDYPCASKCTMADCKYVCYCDNKCRYDGDCCSDCPSFDLGGFYTPECSPEPQYVPPPPLSCPDLNPPCYGNYPCESKCRMTDCAQVCWCDGSCLIIGDCCSNCPSFDLEGYYTPECLA